MTCLHEANSFAVAFMPLADVRHSVAPWLPYDTPKSTVVALFGPTMMRKQHSV